MAATALDVITSDELCSDALFDCLPLSEVMALAVRTFATVQHGTQTAVSHPSCPHALQLICIQGACSLSPVAPLPRRSTPLTHTTALPR